MVSNRLLCDMGCMRWIILKSLVGTNSEKTKRARFSFEQHTRPKPLLRFPFRSCQQPRGIDRRAKTRHIIVEIFNNQGSVMSTVNFSVPEDIKNAFNTVFEGQNKSAVIADLMRDAVEREQRRKQHCSAVDRILANRMNAPRFSEAQFKAAREKDRP